MSSKIISVLSSRYFFFAVVAFFVFQALWFVFSAVYPMAFDEDFHMGVIKIYADSFTPFLNEHPAGADVFGAITRDPSYLYHYVMSFPYRALSGIGLNFEMIVFLFRLTSVALFTWSLFLFRKVLLRAGLSKALAHVILAVFTLIPIVPMLAAHVNYDNLLMVLIALVCLSIFNVLDKLKKQQLDVKNLSFFIILSLFMSVVKYAALPIIAGAFLYVVFMIVKTFGRDTKALLGGAKKGIKAMTPILLGVSVLGLVIGAVLFSEQYVTNLIKYKTPVPDCADVLTVEQCKAYGPWGRNYEMEQNKTNETKDPLLFTEQWIVGLWYRMFFAVNGNIEGEARYATRNPVIIPIATAITFAVISIVVTILYARKIFTSYPKLFLFLSMILVYIVAYWVDVYGQFLKTGEAVAINGRYLIPIMPLILAIVGIGVKFFIDKQVHRDAIKAYAATIVLLLFMNGGGVQTFILRSDSNWFWNNQTVKQLNDDARNILRPLVIEGPAST